ncbi:YkvI family membrane protein [Kordiimonas pumila]|uniref:Membrane protein YkvI n=1 Tax=Kordiimonas pumila TaxID=2161677 RepID=A0ABV7D0K0_9PROT|nr:hypothetical protein [Kordiimonas pumila]
MKNFFERYLVPGLVIQSVLIGGSYATGREITEFFLSVGPFGGLIALLLTIVIFSLCSMVAFELSRQTQTFDYRSFCRTYMGPAWFLFEIGYFATMTITLSVVAAASVEMAADVLNAPRIATAVFFMSVIVGLVYLNSKWLERVMSAWSIVFYIAYAVLFIIAIQHFGSDITTLIKPEPIGFDVLWSSLTYTGYNIAVLPILIFVARHFTTRQEAFTAGALAGPIIMIPGLALFLMLSALYPQVLSVPVPISAVFADMDTPVLKVIIHIAIIGMLIQTGVGLLHGANERVAKKFEENGKDMPKILRPALAFGLLIISTYLATSIGIIDLVAKGFRYSTYYFLAIFVLPLMTIGVWKIIKPK